MKARIALFLLILGAVTTACEIDDAERIREQNERAAASDASDDVAELSAFDLELGDCIRDNLETSAVYAVEVELVPCSSSRAEYRVERVLTTDATRYPPDDFEAEANRRCPLSTEWYFTPTRDSWAAGDRVITCFEPVR